MTSLCNPWHSTEVPDRLVTRSRDGSPRETHRPKRVALMTAGETNGSTQDNDVRR